MEFESINSENLERKERYKLITSIITPRPIAFISSQDENGILNLAPFSFFNGVCSNPPCISIAIGVRPDNGENKDTLDNILKTKEFVVNSADEDIIKKVVDSAAGFPKEINEIEITKLNTLPSTLIKPPRIKESSVQMECKLYDHLQIGDGAVGSTTLVIGEIVYFHINKKILDNGKLTEHYKPSARLGGISYANLAERYNLAVPDWKDLANEKN
ncbi:UNVERIFIED_CONTAM: hypothetical protein GTU68_022229 [Idotea baltica]|nr:hypothetical protein [Idotea baltica]